MCCRGPGRWRAAQKCADVSGGMAVQRKNKEKTEHRRKETSGNDEGGSPFKEVSGSFTVAAVETALTSV